VRLFAWLLLNIHSRLPFSLRLISPVIKDHGVDYERGKFQDKLRDGTLTLVNTEVLFERGWRGVGAAMIYCFVSRNGSSTLSIARSLRTAPPRLIFPVDAPRHLSRFT
jgi:hypothetical protein